VPARHWWAYTLAAVSAHFFATQQAHWPTAYALQCEAFDAAKALLAAGGIRAFIKSPFDRITIREALIFVLIAVIVVPFGMAFWGAAFTVAYRFGSSYWVEWRNLGVSNGVTAIVLLPLILITAQRRSMKWINAEACLLGVAILLFAWIAFGLSAAGPGTSPALLYAPMPLLVWAALRFGVGGVSGSMLLITTMAIWGTMQGRGPFLTRTPSENALALQFFLLVAATPMTLLAAAIGDERRSKDALRLSEERMSLAVQSAQMALWDWDATSDTVWMTDEGRTFFGFAPDARLHFSDLAGRVHPEDGVARTAAIRNALQSGGSCDFEYRIVTPDGSERWIAARGLASGTGSTPRILGVSMDITQQKQNAANAQLQREELAHLSRVVILNAISASLAHELNQPLTSILSNAQAGQRFIATTAPGFEELPAIFEDIAADSRRAGEIIDRMRTMMRRGEITSRPLAVNDSLDEVLRLTQSDFIRRRVNVEKLTTNGLPAALADAVQLQQILLNLIVNACDAMESNPPEDRNLTLTTSVADDEIRIGVLDCGIGLPDDIESLFQPFLTTKKGGLGMGLAICRALVTSLGGRLWAERRAERGAAFHVALPMA
jgi:signal transduction histidine kinase/integral membrane sensor domain MASE1